MTRLIDDIILGHNSLFGVNHLSSETGMKKEKKFSDVNQAINIINTVYDLGVSGMMMSTHPRAEIILNEISDINHLKNDMRFYVLLPYLQKYVTMANEKGAVNMIFDIIKKATLKQKIGMVISGGTFLANRDIYEVLKIMIDVEMQMFKNVNKHSIFLHNILTDMVIGLGSYDIFEFYYNYIESQYKVIPGFCTLNFPRLVDALNNIGIKNPLIMAPFNRLGFQMNPSLDENIDYIKNKECTFIAMSTLAAGKLTPESAYKYLFNSVDVDSVVVGSSSQKHIAETFGTIKKYT